MTPEWRFGPPDAPGIWLVWYPPDATRLRPTAIRLFPDEGDEAVRALVALVDEPGACYYGPIPAPPGLED